MQLGMIGLGRMGANMVRRLVRDGHDCVVFDRDPAAVADLVAERATGAASLAELAQKLDRPRAVWLMVPAAVVDKAVADLVPLLEPGDIVIDGGNSYYVDDIRRAKELAARDIHYVDVGTSGGVWGLERGYCMMIGGEDATVRHLDPIFATLAPGAGSIDRTPGRAGVVGPLPPCPDRSAAAGRDRCVTRAGPWAPRKRAPSPTRRSDTCLATTRLVTSAAARTGGADDPRATASVRACNNETPANRTGTP